MDTEKVLQGTAADFDWRKTASIGWWLQHLSDAYQENPLHMVTELCLVVTILWLIFKPERASKPANKLSAREEEEIIQDWEPEPLVPKHMHNEFAAKPVLLKTGALPRVKIAADASSGGDADGERELIHLASHNYLGFSNDERVKEAAKQTIREYAVGSCGPRGFYGTMDVHLNLERALEEYFGLSAIIYPDYVGLNASVITAFAKRGDLLFIDSACHFMITQGAILSRANIIWYPHNDMAELEAYLQNVQEEDLRYNRPLKRRFIITEGVFHNNGNICNLKELIRLKEEYKYRLILDDSHALGVLHPKGSPGYFNIPQTSIDMYVSAMDTALGSVGGFCIGDKDITYHQRLSGAGYVFTASSPPFQCTAAQTALSIMGTEEGDQLCDKIQDNARMFRKLLQDQSAKRWKLLGKMNEISPLIHIRPTGLREASAQKVIEEVADLCREKGVLVFPAAYLPQEYGIPDRDDPKPSLRVTVTAQHTETDIAEAAEIIITSLESVIGESLVSTAESSDFESFLSESASISQA